jgi:hypothetical protein
VFAWRVPKLKLALTAGLVLLALSGFYLAWLNVASERAENELSRLLGHTQLERANWVALNERTQSLVKFAAWDPAVQDLTARVWHLGAQNTTPRESVRCLRQARIHFQNAIRLRPHWPYSWLNLARVEHALNANGNWPEVLAKALALNLRGQFLQTDLARFRLQLGLKLQGELARSVEANFAQALKDNPWEMVGVAVKLNRPEWACAELKTPEIAASCTYYLSR